MASSSLHFFTLFIILSASVFNELVNADWTKEIEQICHKTDNHQLCLDFFLRKIDPENISFREILGVAIDGAKGKAIRILEEIHALQRRNHYNEEDLGYLGICEHAYETLIKMFKKAERSFKGFQYSDIVYELRGVSMGPSACQISWPSRNNMMSEHDAEMKVYGELALETAKMMDDAKWRPMP